MARLQHPLESHAQGPLFYLVRLADKWHVWLYWFILGHWVVGWRGPDGRKLVFLDLWIVLVLLSLTFLISTKLTRYVVPVYPALAIVVANDILYAVEHVRWGKHWLAVSAVIAVVLVVSRYRLRLDFNSEVKALGQVVQQSAHSARPVIAFQITERVLVFYCRRPVQYVASAEELLRMADSQSLIILTTAAAPLLARAQPQLKFYPVYEGSRYLLATLGTVAPQVRPGSE
jgi:4-amino-4-deoxy-L-arabinose transferase-like glycosyltransferase